MSRPWIEGPHWVINPEFEDGREPATPLYEIRTLRERSTERDVGGKYEAGVADVSGDHTDPRTNDPERIKHTAYLFAAAEDLYGELEDRLAKTRCGCGHPACKRCKDDAETERVLAKARGEEQG
ncbi:MAG TPA: hypothetical protein VKA48_10405 [Gammaproteobacteria bacterium]|nr:hypothetical protein [Gammaproteobacteria bacterium]